MSHSPLHHLIDRLHANQIKPNGEELAEALWLAVRMARYETKATRFKKTRQDEQPFPVTTLKPIQKTLEQSENKQKQTRQQTDSDDAGLHAADSDPAKGNRGGQPIRAPAVPMLPNALGIGRALRPLRRKVPSRSHLILDEEATVECIAEHKVWLPVFKGQPERWLDLMLVVERSPSMHLWTPLVTTLYTLLSRHGAFRDVRMWTLDSDQAVLYSTNDIANPPEILCGPPHRRLIWILSDAVSKAWYQGKYDSLLRLWSTRHPVVLIQLLPNHFWPRTGLRRGQLTYFRATACALPNPRLQPQDPAESENHLPLPVVPLSEDSLSSWARLLIGRADSWSSGVLLDPSSLPTSTNQAQIPPDLRGFRQSASPNAQRLAKYCATIPLTLPIMRLLQEAIALPQTDSGSHSLVELAEVLLSGLLYRKNRHETRPEYFFYEFHDGLRECLLDSLRSQEILDAHSRLSEIVKDKFGHSRDFLALIPDIEATDGKLPLTADSKPFAEVSIKVLRRLGGIYAVWAEQLQQRIKGSSSETSTDNNITTTTQNESAPLEESTPVSDSEEVSTTAEKTSFESDLSEEKFQISEVSIDEQPFSHAKKAKVYPDCTLTWLHLSDIHLCSQKTGWEASLIVEKLLDDLKQMEAEYNLRPDLLFFTGDLAFGQLGKGELSIRSQFEEAHQVVEKIRQAFTQEIPLSRVFLVPGNHDVDRDQILDPQTQYLDNLLNSSNYEETARTTNQLLHEANGEWLGIIRRLEEYKKFLKRHYPHLLKDSTRLCYAATEIVNGIRLGVAGLNSAWSCGREHEKGKLLLGKWQLSTLSSQLKNTDIKIALAHHPFTWLAKQEDPRLTGMLEQSFDFFLHGHEHHSWVDEKSQHTRIAAGACYGEHSDKTGYNFVRLNFKTGIGEVWLRRFDEDGFGWIPRILSQRTDHHGLWKLKLKTRVPACQIKVFLAITPQSLEAERDSVKEYLTQEGFLVLPDAELNQNSVAEQPDLLKKLMMKASAFVQLLDENRNNNFSLIQYEVAKNASLQIWQWRNRYLRLYEIQDKTVRDLLARDTVKVMTLNDFRSYIVTNLHNKSLADTQKRKSNSLPLIYLAIKSDSQSNLEAEITTILKNENLKWKTSAPASDASPTEREQERISNLQYCDAVLIAYDKPSFSSWADSQLTDCQKVGLQKEQNFAAIGVIQLGTIPQLNMVEMDSILPLNCPELTHTGCLPFFVGFIKKSVVYE